MPFSQWAVLLNKQQRVRSWPSNGNSACRPEPSWPCWGTATGLVAAVYTPLGTVAQGVGPARALAAVHTAWAWAVFLVPVAVPPLASGTSCLQAFCGRTPGGGAVPSEM